MSTPGREAAEQRRGQTTRATTAMRSAALGFSTSQAAHERIREQATEASIPSRPPNSPRPVLARVYRLKGPIRVFHRVRSIWVRDHLALARNAVGVVASWARSVGPCRCRLGRRVPLRDTRRKLHKVVLGAAGVPLGDPARGQRRRREGRAVAAARRCGPGHAIFGCNFSLLFSGGRFGSGKGLFEAGRLRGRGRER